MISSESRPTRPTAAVRFSPAVLTVAIALAWGPAYAASGTWDGGGGNNTSWTNSANWNSTYPGASANNTATITSAGSGSVTVTSAVANPLSWVKDTALLFDMYSNGSMTISNASGSGCAGNYNSCFDQGVQIDAGTLTINSGSTSGGYNGKTSFTHFQQNGGTLAGTGVIDVTGYSPSILIDGTMSGSGTTNFLGGFWVGMGTTVTLDRTVNTTDFSLYNGETLAGSGTLTASSYSYVYGGTINRTGATNFNSLELYAGTLAGSGSITATGLTTLSGGTINRTGATNLYGGLSITGVGVVNLITGVTVKGDYDNTFFGTGNGFAKRGNVLGVGAINAYGTISRSVMGGTGVIVSGAGGATGNTPTLTMALGNVHVGDAKNFSYRVANGSSDAILRGAIQTNVNGGNITDARLSGSGVTAGNFGPIATGGNSGDLGVTVTANTGGAITLSGQKVNLVYNYDNVSSQVVTLATTGNAYRYAAANTITTPVNLGIIHVGDSFSTQAVNVTNTATNDVYSEKLNAGIGGVNGDASGSGSISLLGAGSSSSVLSVGLGNANTAIAGAKTGMVAVNFVSDGAGTSGLGTTNLAGQNVTVNGQVNNYAQAAFTGYSGSGLFSGSGTSYVIDLGTILQGSGSATGSLALTNNGGSALFTDLMNGTFNLTGVTDFILAGFSNFTDLQGGSSLSTSTVSLNNTNAGVFDQFVTLSWNGHNADYTGGANSITLELKGTVAAVPEPETYAMLLAGLGLVGVAVRRGKQAEG